MAQVQGDDVWLVEVFEDTDRAKKTLEEQPFTEAVTESRGAPPDEAPSRPSRGPRDPPGAPAAEPALKLFKVAEVTLEDAFLKLTKGEVS
jgi:hypothetical protein